MRLLGALVMLVFWGALLVFVIGAITAAAWAGGGPLFGIVVLLLLLGNAYVWGGWD